MLLFVVVVIVGAMGLYWMLQGLGLGNFEGIILIALGAISVIFAFLMYQGIALARLVMIVILIIELVLCILTLPSGLFFLVLCVIMLYILFRQDVKQYFGA
jgi:hypothetical protein